VNEWLVVGDTDVVVEVAEAVVVGLLSGSCFLLAGQGLVLVDDLLDDLEDVGVELHVDFFGLDDGLYQVAYLVFLLMVAFQSL
jgi:hypothetical protein